MTRVKFCGITNLEDAELCAGHGAWALGMIFVPSSPRRCKQGEAARIVGALQRKVELVGVFQNATLDHVVHTAESLRLTMVQLHGDEGPSYADEVHRRTGAKVIKAVRVRSRATLQAAAAYHTDFLLLDAHVDGLPGGTGQTIDWELVRKANLVAPIILSGGLTPDNVAQAIAVTEPFAVDVASGTESEPGVKDPAKLQAFFEAVRGATVTPAS